MIKYKWNILLIKKCGDINLEIWKISRVYDCNFTRTIRDSENQFRKILINKYYVSVNYKIDI